MITAKSSPLNIAGSRTRTGNVWFLSTSRWPLSNSPYVPCAHSTSFIFSCTSRFLSSIFSFFAQIFLAFLSLKHLSVGCVFHLTTESIALAIHRSTHIPVPACISQYVPNTYFVLPFARLCNKMQPALLNIQSQRLFRSSLFSVFFRSLCFASSAFVEKHCVMLCCSLAAKIRHSMKISEQLSSNQ